MANNLNSNPLFIDTNLAATSIQKKVQAIQWIDDNDDIADGDNVVIAMNESTITLDADDISATSPLPYSVEFAAPVYVETLAVTLTSGHGVVLVWQV